MRILTANLREGLADAAALRALLERERIDVACFQELGPSQAEAVREVLPHGVLEPGWGRRRFYGMGIASRAPLEVHGLPLTGRSGFVAELRPDDWPGLECSLELLNVHVLVPLGRRSWRVPWLRRRQVRELLAHLDAAPARPRLLLGDLNSTPSWPAYRALTSRLRDLHALHVERVRAVGTKPPATWGLWPGGPRWWRLDHALGHEVEAVRVEVVRLEGSDHAGLVVEL